MSLPLVITILMLVLMFLKVPVFISVLTAAVVYFLSSSVPSLLMVQRFIAGVESIPLLAIPFFVGMGVFMNRAGITRRIMAFASVCVGQMSGGLAQVNILVSTLMGGISGSNLADAAMEAKMLVPEMRKGGYSNEFSSVVTAFSSLITPLIPPGIGMIMYASVTGISVGKLFIGGLTVGLLLCIVEMVLTAVISKKRGYKSIRTGKITRKEFFGSLKGAIIPLLSEFCNKSLI